MADDKLPVYPDEVKNEAQFAVKAPPEQVLKHANDADEAMKAFDGHEGEETVLDEVTSKRLLRKIDLNIMPVGIQY